MSIAQQVQTDCFHHTSFEMEGKPPKVENEKTKEM